MFNVPIAFVFSVTIIYIYIFSTSSTQPVSTASVPMGKKAQRKESLSQNTAQSLTSTKNSLLQTKICSYFNMYQKWLNELRNSHQSRALSARFIRNSGMLHLASHAIAPSFGFGSVRV
ncbi:unnamed protein product [Urochloa decumbens]|uniref:ATP synthase F0 subunit 8 n=1 Tax=Urochloa decumbens TaxID=240449 RepID=A0ABC9CVZ1_9POAL